MESKPKSSMAFCLFILILQSYSMTLSHSKSIIKTLPGYEGDLPFKLETGYIEIGKKDDIQLLYYYVESTGNPEEDPFIFYIQGGPGASALITFFYEIGPLSFGSDNQTLVLNPYAWTQMANVVFVDIPAGAGFSYAETEEGWISSDTILVTQANEFLKKFLIDHPKLIKNPLYTAGISYVGIILPKVTLEIYEGNERGDQPTLNIQKSNGFKLNNDSTYDNVHVPKGYILMNPLTDKFTDFNSRFEYAHRMALISDDIYQLGIKNCRGNYVEIDKANSLCAKSLQRYDECTSHVYFYDILGQYCEDSISTCADEYTDLDIWVRKDDVQKALNIRQGKIEEFVVINNTLHYFEGKNDSVGYSYNVFSSIDDHKKLANRNCRALFLSGDHDMTFPYNGLEQWIASLNLGVQIPWTPYFVDDQVGGYKTKYAQKDYTLTFATIKGSGHQVPYYKPKESFACVKNWFSSQIYSSDS